MFYLQTRSMKPTCNVNRESFIEIIVKTKKTSNIIALSHYIQLNNILYI